VVDVGKKAGGGVPAVEASAQQDALVCDPSTAIAR